MFCRLRQLAIHQGWKLGEMSFYVKCGMENVPPGMQCPKKVFGIGPSEGKAKFTAKIYATLFGYKKCDEHVGECEIIKPGFKAGFKFMKGPKLPQRMGK